MCTSAYARVVAFVFTELCACGFYALNALVRAHLCACACALYAYGGFCACLRNLSWSRFINSSFSLTFHRLFLSGIRQHRAVLRRRGGRIFLPNPPRGSLFVLRRFRRDGDEDENDDADDDAEEYGDDDDDDVDAEDDDVTRRNRGRGGGGWRRTPALRLRRSRMHVSSTHVA